MVAALAMLDVFVKLNLNKAQINVNMGVSNNIEYYVDWLHLFSVGILRVVFLYGMAYNAESYSNLLTKLQDGNIVEHAHRKSIYYAVNILCMVSWLTSIFVPIMGLDVLHFMNLKADGWMLHDVFLQREYDISVH